MTSRSWTWNLSVFEIWVSRNRHPGLLPAQAASVRKRANKRMHNHFGMALGDSDALIVGRGFSQAVKYRNLDPKTHYIYAHHVDAMELWQELGEA